MYDAIVVGARCGGSPTAMLLARRGLRVLLVDKATFPSDTFRQHFIRQPGVACLKRWGLLERVAASNCPAVGTMTVDLGDFPLTGSVAPVDGVGDAYAPRRFVLDTILAEAAVEAGAELREGFAVDDLIVEDDRVAGIRGRTTERARLVIGADGVHSLVARRVDAPTYEARPAVACYYHSYWSDVPVDGIEVYFGDGQFVVAFATNDGLTGITIGWPVGAFQSVRAAVERQYLGALDRVPALAERIRGGRREEPFAGTADLPNFFRRPYGAGWALVGDAGYHKDPMLAYGISDAFRDAELLADAVEAGFGGRLQPEAALADYERRRNIAALPLYDLNYQMATLQPPSMDVLQLRQALRGNPADTARFLGVNAGTVPAREFFAPENIQRILTAARGGLPFEPPLGAAAGLVLDDDAQARKLVADLVAQAPLSRLA
jgi:flavin-dependent dehydrogenase